MNTNNYRQAHRLPTPDQLAAINAVLTRSALWHWLAKRVLHLLCWTLGYPLAGLQSSSTWVTQFALGLSEPKNEGERKTFVRLADMSRRRNGVVVMVLFLGGQHARILYHRDATACPEKPKDVRPYRILDRAHCSATRLLTRMLGAAVGCVKQGYGGTTHIAKTVRRFVHWVLGPGDPEIRVHGVLRWQAVADTAAGVTARRPDTLQKSHKNRKAGPLSAVVWAETCRYVRDAYFRMPLRTAQCILLLVGNMLAVYYLVRLTLLAAQHIAHALA